MIRINLLPSEFLRRNRAFANISMFFLIIFILAFICGIMSGIYLYNFSLIEKAAAERDMLMEKLEEVDGTAAEISRIKNDIKDLERRLAFINSIDIGAKPFSTILSEVGSSVPDEAWLTYMAITGEGQLSIQGWSVDFTSLAEFMEKLAASGLFDDLELVKGYRSEGEVNDAVNFELRCRLKRGD